MDHICTIYIEKDLMRTHGGDEQVPRCPHSASHGLAVYILCSDHIYTIHIPYIYHIDI